MRLDSDRSAVAAALSNRGLGMLCFKRGMVIDSVIGTLAHRRSPRSPGTLRKIQPSMPISQRLPVAMLFVLLASLDALAADRLLDHFPQAARSGCLTCHQEIPTNSV